MSKNGNCKDVCTTFIYIQKNKIIKTDYVRNINKKKTELKKHNSREYPGKYMLKTNISAGINRELNYKHISFCLQIHSSKDFLLYIKTKKKSINLNIFDCQR